MSGEYERFDPVSGLPRWDLPDGRYILGDTSIGGGSVRIMRADGLVALVVGFEDVAEVIGRDHPAIAYSRRATDDAREAQREAGRQLAQIMRDGRRR